MLPLLTVLPPHGATVGADAAGGDHAGVVHHVGEQVLRCRRLQYHGAAIGLQRAAVAHGGIGVQALLEFTGDLDVDQAVAVEVEHGLVGTVEVDVAVVGQDQAVIRHAAADQAHRAAARRGDGAVVDHAGAAAVRVEVEVVGEEVAGREVQRAGDQAAHVHLRGGTEDDAVGVDQEHLTVGVDAAEDLTGVLVEDAVQRHRAERGLVELYRGVLAHVEREPVQRELVRQLVDDGGVAALADRADTADYRATSGRGQRADRHRAGVRSGYRHAAGHARVCRRTEHAASGERHRQVQRQRLAPRRERFRTMTAA
jgi:hypothetical protein